jgi:hypothetical protein
MPRKLSDSAKQKRSWKHRTPEKPADLPQKLKHNTVETLYRLGREAIEIIKLTGFRPHTVYVPGREKKQYLPNSIQRQILSSRKCRRYVHIGRQQHPRKDPLVLIRLKQIVFRARDGLGGRQRQRKDEASLLRSQESLKSQSASSEERQGRC